MFFGFALFFSSMNINVELGSRTYFIASNESKTIYISTELFPTYFVFNSYHPNTVFHYFRKEICNTAEIEEINTMIRFLPLWFAIKEPFSRIMIDIPDNSNLSFSTMAFPGMCSNGVFFSSKKQQRLLFSKDGFGFFKLSPYDDKCIFFSYQNESNFSLSIKSSDQEDQLFYYSGFKNYSSISGNYTDSITNYNSSNPILLRIIADDNHPPDLVQIMYQTENSLFQDLRDDVHEPYVLPMQCDPEDTWYDEKLAIFFVTLSLLLGISCLFILFPQCYSSDKPLIMPDSSINDDSSFSSIQISNPIFTPRKKYT